MSDINLQLVREFFELNQFRVHTRWQQGGWASNRSDLGMQLYVDNPFHRHTDLPPALISTLDMPRIERAVVEVRPWHSDRFYASAIERSPGIVEFATPEALAPAHDYFGTDEYRVILVISELPLAPAPRDEALQALHDNGIHHVLEFPVILRELVDRVTPNGSFNASPTLQLIQLLNRYNLTRHHQMEFSYPMDPHPGPVHVEVADDDNEDSLTNL